MNARVLSDAELAQALAQAQEIRAAASLRATGSARMLGDLQLRALEPGVALRLSGLKHRDAYPAEGTPVTLTLLLPEEVLRFEAPMLSPMLPREGDPHLPPQLRVGWPQAGVVVARRRDLRVAATGQEPLPALVTTGGRIHKGLLLNLTETGLGLALEDLVHLDPGGRVTVSTTLPEGGKFHCEGEMRHATTLEGDPHPTRLGLLITAMSPENQERLHAFIQLRRTDRSESLRHGR